MEAKLSSYRSQKRRQAILNIFKDRLYNMVSFQQVRVDEKSTHVIVEADTDPQPRSKENITPVHKAKSSGTVPKKPRPVSESDSIVSVGSTLSTDSDDDQTKPDAIAAKPPRSYLTYITYLVYFFFWVTLYAIAIELRFGVVFFMMSALLGIYFNTRTEKTPGEISAYSVFNENCESIDGTLKAEQFEREIGIRH
ncbi:SAYSvFN domain-containing protein 1 [Ochlerotatus camptorhynchus]|uniref:SAYSvFN domain-containing protein 1 n=1 Tax=Ochlerotatus camptorhynchus TaxID=644619 RepID=UPI0031D49411